ncbi:aspartate/glutamate racemase family protein [Pseudochelatococcus sp. B33]
MRILIVKPYAGKSRELEHCRKIARPDTEVDFENLEGDYPITHVHHEFFRHHAISAALERIMAAEEKGYDGVLIACGSDPGLLEARELVDIPVSGTLEAAGHIACTMGHKFSIVTATDYTIPRMETVARQYGYGHKLASVRALNIPGRKLYENITAPQTVVDTVNAMAERCVKEDGAEVIILTATLAASMYTNATNASVAANGVPLLDALALGFKTCEMMVDLRLRAGIEPVSRVNRFRKPYEPEYRKMRAFMERPLYRGLNPDEEPELVDH